MTRLTDLISRFRRDERGVFLVVFAVMAVVLIATSGAVVDFTRVQQARTRAQTGLDAAALALQSQIGVLNDDQIKTKAQDLLRERIGDSSITATIFSATTDPDEGRLTLLANITVPTAFVQLVGFTSIDAHLQSEVKRASSDLEVSLSLDVTGSMEGSRIAELISASNSLIDLLVKTSQTPSYSRMAIVPWSSAVNVGSYANAIRGTPTPGVTISDITYKGTVVRNITNITNDNPGVIKVDDVTNLANGDWVYISGVKGMTDINGKYGQIQNLSTKKNTFDIGVCTTSGKWSCGYDAYSSSGNVTKCKTSQCREVVTTSENHGLATGDYAYITGVSGMSSFNNKAYGVEKIDDKNYVAVGSSPSNGVRSSGGSSYCTKYGCEYQRFQPAWVYSSPKIWKVNSCATDRTTNPFTDDAPSSHPLSMNYRSSSGEECLDYQVMPLTSDKTELHKLINKLEAAGSTSGHLGLAWGWYMISPKFAYLWPNAENKPAAYGKDGLVKAVIFMTDGAFNTPYCDGIVASDGLDGSGGADTHKDCASPNGSSKSQAEKICDEIKKPDNHVILYTVSFKLDEVKDADAISMLQTCATSPKHYYKTGGTLTLAQAFAEIAQSLSELRISK